jgi:hypothetical protein
MIPSCFSKRSDKHRKKLRPGPAPNAFVLAATRRLTRPADAPPLSTIRSLAYFLPVIEEVIGLRINPDYFRHLRHKLERIAPTR